MSVDYLGRPASERVLEDRRVFRFWPMARETNESLLFLRADAVINNREHRRWLRKKFRLSEVPTAQTVARWGFQANQVLALRRRYLG